jgi:hypothetical protein
MEVNNMAREYERDPSLYDWAANSGYGIIGLSCKEELPDACVSYAISAWPFFGLKENPVLEKIARIGAWYAYLHVDWQDPYTLFLGISDVNYTEDWQKFAYEIHDEYSNRVIEADPEHLETFSKAPEGQCEEVYYTILKLGGEFVTKMTKGALGPNESILDTLPNCSGMAIQDFMEGDYFDGNPYDLIDDLVAEKEFELVTNKDQHQMRFYFEVSAWAAFLWFAGPEGRYWRNTHHDIFYMVNNDGEGLLYEGGFIEKKHFRKVNRAPQSCVMCGIEAWCVDMVQIEGTHRFMCEYHVNGVALFPEATCGAKVCRSVMCEHHPFYGSESATIDQLRRSGGLSTRARQKSLLESNLAPKMLGK